MSAAPLSRVRPWSGLILGATGWFLDHQLGADLIFHDCRRGGPWLSGGLAIICGLLVVAGGAMSWTASRHANLPTNQNREFSGLVAAGAAALFLLAILLQTFAGFIVPACHR